MNEFNEYYAHIEDDYRRINAMMQEKGVFHHAETGKDYYTGYAYATLYDWDQYFETLVQLYLGWDTTLARNGVEIFLDLQKENGHIQRSSNGTLVAFGLDPQTDEHVKPFLAQISLLLYNRDGQVNFLRKHDFYYFKRMAKYLDYWLLREENYHGLAFWDSAPHTGMDNQHERAGYWREKFCCGVDLNAYLVRECRAFAELAEILGRTEEAQTYRERANTLAEAIQTYMWDETDGFFYDVDRRTGKKLKVRYIGAFATMWAEIATEKQAKNMVENYLLNPDEFFRGFTYPTLAASEKGYTEGFVEKDLGCNWRAHTWIPTNYYVFESLRKYGYAEEATRLAKETYVEVKKIGDREYYATESRTGCGLNPFWGWSLLAYFMPYEDRKDFDPTEICVKPNRHRVL